MTLPVIFHDLAEEELNEAAAYYARARPGLGDAFLTEVDRAIDALLVTPLAGTLVDKDVRWWLVKRFLTASCTEYATITSAFSLLLTRSGDRSTGADADDPGCRSTLACNR